MRTTVTLEREIAQKLRAIAMRTRRPFKRVLNDALRSALAGMGAADDAEPFVVKARPMNLRSGYDPIGFSKLADDLEGAAFLESTERLKRHLE